MGGELNVDTVYLFSWLCTWWRVLTSFLTEVWSWNVIMLDDVTVGAKLQLGPSCRLPTASPGRWIGGRPPDMVASCDLSWWPHLTNKQSRTWQRQSYQTYWLGGRKGIRPVKTWGVVGMGSPLVLAGVASTRTVGARRLHYPPLAPQKSRTNNDGVL